MSVDIYIYTRCCTSCLLTRFRSFEGSNNCFTPYTGNTKTLRASIFLSIGQMGRIPQLGRLSASKGGREKNGSPANLEPKWHKRKAMVKSHPHHPLCTLCNCYFHTTCSTQQLLYTVHRQHEDSQSEHLFINWPDGSHPTAR